MPTPTLITDLDPVASNNFPAGSDAPSTLDDTLRAHGAFIRQALNATQTQLYTAFTTGGTTTAYTLTPAPALTALAANQRFRVKFNATHTSTTPTLAISGLTAKSLKVYNSAGAKADPAVGALVANMLTDVEYDGTDMVVLDQLPATASAASETASGVVELATTAEVKAGTDTARVPSVASMRAGLRFIGAYTTLTGLSDWDSEAIPSWATEIKVHLVNVSTSGTNAIIAQLSDSGGRKTSGYVSTGGTVSTSGYGESQYTAGFGVRANLAADVYSGTLTFSLVDATNFVYVASGTLVKTDSIGDTLSFGGTVTMTGLVTAVRVTTNSGDTFDTTGGTPKAVLSYT